MSNSLIREYLALQLDSQQQFVPGGDIARRYLPHIAIGLIASLALVALLPSLWPCLLVGVCLCWASYLLPLSQGASLSIAVLVAISVIFFQLPGGSMMAKLLVLGGVAALACLGYIIRRMRCCYYTLTHQAQHAASLGNLTEALLRTNRDCIKLFDINAELRLVNARGRELMQWDDVTTQQGLDWLGQQRPEVQQKLQQTWLRTLKDGYGDMQGWLSHSNGEAGHFHVSMVTVKDGQGKAEHVLVVTHDINQLVESRLAAECSNRELNALLDSLDGLFMALDEQQQIVYSNARAREFLQSHQLTNAESNQQNGLPPVLKTAVIDALDKANGQDRQTCIDVQDPDSQRWLRIKVYPKATGFNLFITDITEDHERQQALRLALIHAELVQELEGFGSWEYELSNRQLKLCKSGVAILGLAPGEVRDNFSLINRLMEPQDRINLTRALLEVSQGVDKSVIHSRVKHPGGETINIRIALRCLKDPLGHPVKIIGTLQDVSEQKARETYLQEAERFVRGIIDSLPSQICVIDEQGILLNVNRSWQEFGQTGMGGMQPIGRGANYLKVCEASASLGCEDALLVLDGIKTVINNEQTDFELEYCMPVEHTLEWFLLKVNPLLKAGDGERLFVISHENITRNKQLMLEYQSQRDRLKQVLCATNDGIWDWQLEDGTTYYSDRFLSLIGRPGQRLPAFNQWLAEALAPNYREHVLTALNAHLEQAEANFDMECQLQTGTGRFAWFRLRGRAQFEQGKPIRFVGGLMDIGENHQLMDKLIRQERQFLDMAESIPDVFWDYDVTTDHFRYVSPAFERIWEHPMEVVEDLNLKWWLDTVDPADRGRTLNLFCSALNTGNNVFAEYRIETGLYGQKWISTRAFVVTDEQGAVSRLVGTSRDVTQAKMTQCKLKEVTRLDNLTGLPNRAAFMLRLEEKIQQDDSGQQRFALVFIDIDRLTALNDSVGYEVGDEVLRQVASRLLNYCADNEFVARIGGDEFALLLPLDGESNNLHGWLNDLISSFNTPFMIKNSHFFTSVSIGAAIYPRHGFSSAEILRTADAAMLEVKSKGGGFYQICKQANPQVSLHGSHLETELRLAIEHQQFELHYQVKVSATHAKPLSCEALLRWRHPDKGLVPPLDFIPHLENSGLINTVGEWVLNTALAQINQWHQMGFADLTMAINVSPRQVGTPGFCDMVANCLRKQGVSAGKVELELTETALMSDLDRTDRVITQLRAMGVSIAIDDFGTGYSSFSYLRRFRPDTIKIDKQFVDDIEHDEEPMKILQGILSISRDLGICTVAEGVESQAQWQLLRAAGCDALQGYLFSRPLSGEEFTRQVLQSQLAALQEAG